MFNNEKFYGWIPLAIVCRIEDSLPGIGGTYDCTYAPGSSRVGIARFSDLHLRPEFEVLEAQNKTITPLDVAALQITVLSDYFENIGVDGLRMRSSNDTTVNVVSTAVSEQTRNQTTVVGTAPAKHVVFIFTYESEEPSTNLFGRVDNTVNGKMFDLFVLGNNTNTGYSLFSWGVDDADVVAAPPPSIKQIMDSFELLK